MIRRAIDRGSVREFFKGDPSIAFNSPLRGAGVNIGSLGGALAADVGTARYRSWLNGKGLYLNNSNVKNSIAGACQNEMTLMIWVRPDATGNSRANNGLMSFCDAMGVGACFLMDASGIYRFYALGAGDVWQIAVANDARASRGGVHLIVGRSSNGVQMVGSELIVDGKLQATRATGCQSARAGSVTYVGSYAAGSYGYFFNGHMAEPTVFYRCLSLREIADYYHWSIDKAPRKYFVVPSGSTTQPYYQQLLRRRAA